MQCEKYSMNISLHSPTDESWDLWNSYSIYFHFFMGLVNVLIQYVPTAKVSTAHFSKEGNCLTLWQLYILHLHSPSCSWSPYRYLTPLHLQYVQQKTFHLTKAYCLLNCFWKDFGDFLRASPFREYDKCYICFSTFSIPVPTFNSTDWGLLGLSRAMFLFLETNGLLTITQTFFLPVSYEKRVETKAFCTYSSTRGICLFVHVFSTKTVALKNALFGLLFSAHQCSGPMVIRSCFP